MGVSLRGGCGCGGSRLSDFSYSFEDMERDAGGAFGEAFGFRHGRFA